MLFPSCRTAVVELGPSRALQRSISRISSWLSSHHHSFERIWPWDQGTESCQLLPPDTKPHHPCLSLCPLRPRHGVTLWVILSFHWGMSRGRGQEKEASPFADGWGRSMGSEWAHPLPNFCPIIWPLGSLVNFLSSCAQDYHVSNCSAPVRVVEGNWYQWMNEWIDGWFNDSLESQLEFEQETGREGQHLLAHQITFMPFGKKKNGYGRGRAWKSLNWA